MKCPNCNNEFPLTWKRYLSGPTGTHTCPTCRRKSRLSFTRKYVLCSVVPTGLIAVGFAVFFWFMTKGHWTSFFYAVGASLVALPLDKYCDEAFRPLEPID